MFSYCNKNVDVFCSFLVVMKHGSMSNEGIAGVFKKGGNAIFPVEQDLKNGSTDLEDTWKSPGILP